MARGTHADVVSLVRREGAPDETAEAIVATLNRAGLSVPEMRRWLSHPMTAHTVNGQVPIHAIEDGRADDVLAAAREFGAASEDDRYIARTLVCGLYGVRRLTHDDVERRRQVRQIAEILLNKLRKPVAVNEALQTTLSGDYEDQTRLVDWMLDERLGSALDALRSGELDPVALRHRDSLLLVGW